MMGWMAPLAASTVRAMTWAAVIAITKWSSVRPTAHGAITELTADCGCMKSNTTAFNRTMEDRTCPCP
jgi:hypothetical protein